MIWIDFAMIGLVFISLIIGLFRGLVREAFALITWGLAIWVGLTFGREFSVFLETMIDIASARLAAGFAVLFFMTLLLGSTVSYLLGEIITKTGLTGTDRFLGMIFGIGRGILVVSIIVVLAGLTPLPDEPWWQESKLIPPFQSVAVWVRSQVPDSLAGHINYQQ